MRSPAFTAARRGTVRIGVSVRVGGFGEPLAGRLSLVALRGTKGIFWVTKTRAIKSCWSRFFLRIFAKLVLAASNNALRPFNLSWATVVAGLTIP